MVSIIFLAINCATDIKSKKISLILSVVFGVFGVIMNITVGSQSGYSVCLGTLLGIFLILLSKITKEAIGMGDGLVVSVLGIFNGGTRSLSTLLYAFMVSSVISILLLSIKKVSRKEKLPFIPCLLAGYLIVLILEALG